MTKISRTSSRTAKTRKKTARKSSPTATQPAAPKRMSERQLAQAYKLEQTLFTRLKREVLAKDYVQKSVFEAALVSIVDQFIAVLGEFERALPLKLVGLSPGEMEREIARRCRLAREELAARKTIELTRADAKAAAKRGRGRPPRGAYAGQGRKRK